MEQYAHVSDEDVEVNDDIFSENEEHKDFINVLTLIQSQPSDYYRFQNIERLISSAEEDAFSQSDVDSFLDSDVEAQNCVQSACDLDEDDLEIDDFENLKRRIKNSRIKFSFPVNLFFNSVCYAVRFALSQKLTKWK